MTLSTVRLGAADGALAAALTALRSELELSEEFPSEVEVEASAAVASAVLPSFELLDLPFLTIDPEGSMDLDQAMHLAREGDGYRVWYAIADVPAFVAPGGALDAETRRRGQTLYPPDGRIPLHPTVISEGAASLLPDEVRGAFVWEFALDQDARVTATTLTRARVRSRARWTYEQVQKALDEGTAHDGTADTGTGDTGTGDTDTAEQTFVLLKEIGLKREAIEQQRGGASLGRPDQEIRELHGRYEPVRYELVRRRPLAAEGWNAQLSLMTGMAAATIMLEGGVGILRTMPPPDAQSLDWFRRRAKALGHPWAEAVGYGAYLSTLDADDPQQLAIMHAAASLFRGAGYLAFDGDVPPAEKTVQAAIAAPYAHATAPLRRLVDRFTLTVCEALANGREIPAWARAALPELPAIMSASDGLAGRLDHAAISAVEAAVLSARIGETFTATVLTVKNGGGSIQLDDLAVTANCKGELVAGSVIPVRLVTAEIATGTVLFETVETVESGSAQKSAAG